MIREVGIIALTLLLASVSKADFESAPYPYIETSASRSVFFKMVPAETHWNGKELLTKREAFGVAYRIEEEGGFKELWKTQGWYAFKVYVMNDGKNLVRIGPWACDKEKHTDLAIAFYKEGKLLKSHRVCDLIRDTDSLEYSVSHYWWRKSLLTESDSAQIRGRVYLNMLDDTGYTFDVETGEILNHAQGSGAIEVEGRDR